MLFTQNQGRRLGTSTNNGQLFVSSKEVEAVVDWPISQSIHEVHSLVGLCSYYRRFIKDLCETAAPLHALTQKDKLFSWNLDCQSAFEKLKSSLTAAPVLAMPNDYDLFILNTDTSNESTVEFMS